MQGTKHALWSRNEHYETLQFMCLHGSKDPDYGGWMPRLSDASVFFAPCLQRGAVTRNVINRDHTLHMIPETCSP